MGTWLAPARQVLRILLHVVAGLVGVLIALIVGAALLGIVLSITR